MKKVFLIILFFILLNRAALSEEPDISWTGNLLTVSVSGAITKGDKMRFIFRENECNTIHQSFSIYTYSKNSNFKQLENKVISMTLNGEPFKATVIFARPFLMGTSVWFNVGSYKFKNFVLKLKKVSKYEITIIDCKDFISENYFDIPTNSWDLTNIDQVLYSARQLCIKRSKSSYPPKIV